MGRDGDGKDMLVHINLHTALISKVMNYAKLWIVISVLKVFKLIEISLLF